MLLQRNLPDFRAPSSALPSDERARAGSRPGCGLQVRDALPFDAGAALGGPQGADRRRDQASAEWASANRAAAVAHGTLKEGDGERWDLAVIRYDWYDYDKSVDFESSATSIWRVPNRPETVPKALGRRIRELRKQKRWSQERLADEAAMHRTYMWGIERGSRNPSLGHLTRIADALEVSLSALFEGV